MKDVFPMRANDLDAPIFLFLNGLCIESEQKRQALSMFDDFPTKADEAKRG